MPSPASISCDVFLANLRQSGLLTEDEYSVVEREARTMERGRLLARSLVDRGVLTRFQAEQLMGGRTNGFNLGQYVILDQIGAGGMGRVYRARHRHMGRVVAVKILSSKLVKTDRAQELFQREARAAARLLHPNIVAAYDFNHVGSRYFLVMEYVNGPNLEQLVRKEGPLPIGQACDFVRQAANGLQCAFNMGMVHRDIKPANLLVHRPEAGQPIQGIIKLTDFGLARLSETKSSAGPDGAGTLLVRDNSVMGTPDYLSPEQARDLHKTDIRSDLYSLGCTFYFLLTGSVPFPGGTTLEKLIRHGVQEPTPVEHLRLDVPQEIAAVVQRLMAKDPEIRYQTPAELADALAPYAVGSPANWNDPRKSSSSFGSDAGLEVEEEEVGAGEAGSGAEFLFHPTSWDDSSAMAGTVPTDLSATPLSTFPTSQGSRTFADVLEEERRRLRQVLIWTGAIIGAVAVIGGIAYLMWPR
jgi:serine/threonine protein kinase